MSAAPGKIEVQGVTEIQGEEVFTLRFIQARNPDWVQRPFFAKFDASFARLHDWDQDGDLDMMFTRLQDQEVLVLLAETFQDRIGAPRPFFQVANSSSFNLSDKISLADIDGDEDTDVIAGAYWYESRPLGDADGNGRFEPSDLVKVFQAGEYDDDLQDNSTFEDGDWNADGEFDSSDLVLAFQSGTYVSGATKSRHNLFRLPHELVAAAFDDSAYDALNRK